MNRKRISNVRTISCRDFLTGNAATAVTVLALPLIVSSSIFGADRRIRCSPGYGKIVCEA